MEDSLKFEVRPVEGAVAVVGETVTFRRDGDKLYAFNEDGEAFGVVPSRYAAELEALSKGSAAEVVGRSGGCFVVAVGDSRAIGDLQKVAIPQRVDDSATGDNVAQVDCPAKANDSAEGSAKKGKRKKRILVSVVVIAVLLIGAVASCTYVTTPQKSSEVSQEMYEIGLEAIEVVEEYLADERTSSSTYDRLGLLYDDAEAVYDSTGLTGDLGVQIKLLSLQLDFFYTAEADETISRDLADFEDCLIEYPYERMFGSKTDEEDEEE